jgi:hypothetical protein
VWLDCDKCHDGGSSIFLHNVKHIHP